MSAAFTTYSPLTSSPICRHTKRFLTGCLLPTCLHLPPLLSNCWLAFRPFSVALEASLQPLCLRYVQIRLTQNNHLVTNTHISQVATGFLIAANITSTVLFATLVGVFNSSLKEYGVKSNLGANAFAASWLALGLSLVSTFFWLFSSCCCSGRTEARRSPAQGSYEKVDFANGDAAPHHGHTTAPAPTFANTNTAYEPYRHQ